MLLEWLAFKRKFILFIEFVILTFQFSSHYYPMRMDQDSNFKVFPALEGGSRRIQAVSKFLEMF